MNEGGSIVTLTYHGSTKVLPGYNVMGVAKAALEASVTTEEVGDCVTFLFSKMSSSITGQVIYADHGYNIMGI